MRSASRFPGGGYVTLPRRRLRRRAARGKCDDAATAAPAPINALNGMNARCARYYEVCGGDTWSSLTQIAAISLSDFFFLNLEINSTSWDNLWVGYSYCVRSVGDVRTYPGYATGQGTSSPIDRCAAGAAWDFPVFNATGGAAPTCECGQWTRTMFLAPMTVPKRRMRRRRERGRRGAEIPRQGALL